MCDVSARDLFEDVLRSAPVKATRRHMKKKKMMMMMMMKMRWNETEKVKENGVE